ncbi:MAG: sporulation protein YqfD [Clostridia bacterium]|nr:sporulation protein YqfD [Clostridia bacterium]
MFVRKIFYFLKGYVIINIIGRKGAKLINAAEENGIPLWNVSPNKASVMKKDLKALTCIANDEGVEFLIEKEISFRGKYLKDYGWFFILGTFLIVIAFYTASGYIWEIEINTDNEELKAEISEILSENGVTVGAKKSQLPPLNDLRDSIIYGTDSVSWSWVYLDGILARVEVTEKTEAPPLSENTPGNISATKDGIIYSVSAKNGETLFKKGDAVSAGDIVISGVIQSENVPPRIVSADGEVLAETSYTESIILPLYKTYTEDTGNTFTFRTLRLFSLEIPLSRQKALPFESYRTEENINIIGISSYKYIETESSAHQIPIDTVVFEAKEYMYKKILQNTSKTPKKTNENVTYEHITSDKIKVTLTVNFIEDIGEPSPIQKSQTEDKEDDKTD